MNGFWKHFRFGIVIGSAVFGGFGAAIVILILSHM